MILSVWRLSRGSPCTEEDTTLARLLSTCHPEHRFTHHSQAMHGHGVAFVFAFLAQVGKCIEWEMRMLHVSQSVVAPVLSGNKPG